LINEYFKNRHNQYLQLEVVKLKEIGQYPKFNPKNPSQPHSRNLHLIKYTDYVKDREHLDGFINKNQNLNDHQGVKLTKTGSRFTSLYALAKSEEMIQRSKSQNQMNVGVNDKFDGG